MSILRKSSRPSMKLSTQEILRFQNPPRITTPMPGRDSLVKTFWTGPSRFRWKSKTERTTCIRYIRRQTLAAEGFLLRYPLHEYGWESYHSELNQVSGVSVPAPALCENLALSNRRDEWDFYDQSGRIATVYREFKISNDTFRSKLLYLRADLMRNYLSSERNLVWLVWGERNFHYKSLEAQGLRDAFTGHAHIHRRWTKWEPSITS